uniref:Uncharacterized protein n=1 Tax=Anguilla anguilla TaxID=7936 RepID=A0A0E9R8L8_ANGAN
MSLGYTVLLGYAMSLGYTVLLGYAPTPFGYAVLFKIHQAACIRLCLATLAIH